MRSLLSCVSVALLPVLVGCAQASPPLAAATSPAARHAVLPARFVGAWDAPGHALVVLPDGRATVVYFTHRPCSADQTMDCDQPGGVGVPGGRDDMVFTTVDQDVAGGTVVRSTSADLAGSAVTFTVTAKHTGDLRHARQPDFTWTYCRSDAPRPCSD